MAEAEAPSPFRQHLLSRVEAGLRSAAPSFAGVLGEPSTPLETYGIPSLEMFGFLIGLAPEFGFEWADDIDEAVFYSLDTIVDHIAPIADIGRIPAAT